MFNLKCDLGKCEGALQPLIKTMVEMIMIPPPCSLVVSTKLIAAGEELII
jgi:hypothetical protein